MKSSSLQLTGLSLAEATRGLEAGEFSARELVEASLERISALQPRLNCFIAILAERARIEADAADRRRAKGERRGPLDGIPVAVKDNIDVAGAPATAGMAVRKERVPEADAFCVARLREAGAVILAKANLHEAALGATNDNPHFGRCFNPHGQYKTPGGSSGGSTVAVAANLVQAALGTDTIGSIRIPASYCGVVGLKPTYGLISTGGVCYASWRMDHVGPMARTVGDIGILLPLLAGYDASCPESRRPPQVDDRAGLAGLRLGVLKNYEKTGVAAAVGESFARAVDLFSRLGCRLSTVSIPDFEPAYARRCGLLMVESDAAIVHEGVLAERPEMLSSETRAMLAFAHSASAAKLAKAERVVALAAAAAQRLFDEVDAVISPATPQTAFSFDEPVPDNQGDFTALANFAGCPAISVPMGVDAEGMPMGLQLMGPAWSERRLLEIARAFETASTKK